MTSRFDPQYVLARKVLLDVLEALVQHRQGIVLVGAQAIYLHVGEADFAVAPYTTDADLTIDPRKIADEPLLEEVLSRAGFRLEDNPGAWRSSGGIAVDFMVPESLSGPGRRGANLGAHGRTVARKARGLEAALVDYSYKTIRALEPEDQRVFELAVAGPSALLVAKLHKIGERIGQANRLDDKDALDVLRLLRGTSLDVMTALMPELLVNDVSREVTSGAMKYLKELFGTQSAKGARMAGQALVPLENPDEISASCVALTNELLEALSSWL